ncbi:uncharacterized protein PAC_16051 [Phialocephala subalpina]|uniref:AA1-like domain-containing protein n=1 Tax=Phialocephala subalpina TaxID=576137 RepID=A0A1L7XM67_9HELO|nr:uncharacterized protein PAC_16051 [Phialocephala subalpina]
MRCFQIINIILGFAFLSNALPQVLPYRPVTVSRRHIAGKHAISGTDAIVHKDFLISDFYASSTPDSTYTSFNHTLSFTFVDPNSGTETVCARTWMSTANTTGAPFGPSYQVCDPTAGANGKQEFFDWHLKTWTDMCHFSLELAHEFSDPVNYKPPYDYVEYFAPVNVTLVCLDAAGTQGCTLPTSTSPLHAVITSLAN